MNGRPLQGRRGCASRCVEGRRVDRVLSRSRPTSRTGEPSRARGLGPTSATSMEHHSAVRFAHDGPFSRSGSRTGQRPIARRARSSHRPGDPDAADLPCRCENSDSPPDQGFRGSGFPTPAWASHLFSQHCRARPNPMAHLRTDALSRKDVSHVSGHLGTDLEYLRGPVGCLQFSPSPCGTVRTSPARSDNPITPIPPGHPRPNSSCCGKDR